MEVHVMLHRAIKNVLWWTGAAAFAAVLAISGVAGAAGRNPETPIPPAGGVLMAPPSEEIGRAHV